MGVVLMSALWEVFVVFVVYVFLCLFDCLLCCSSSRTRSVRLFVMWAEGGWNRRGSRLTGSGDCRRVGGWRVYERE